MDPGLPVEGQPVASMRFIGADYLEAMRIPTVRGRSFTNAESRDVESATALVNATMARRYWADGDAVGRRIRLLGNENGDLDLTIVGIVGDVAQRQLPGVPENQVYLPLAHASELSFVLRTTGEPGLLAPHVRAAVSEADAAMPVTIRTMADVYAWYVWDRRGQGLVLAVLGGVALLLAALGIYGVMSLMVANRRREIGVRMALGSTRPAVRRLVVGASLRLTAVGVAAGLLLGMAATTGLASIFHRGPPLRRACVPVCGRPAHGRRGAGGMVARPPRNGCGPYLGPEEMSRASTRDATACINCRERSPVGGSST